MGRPTTSASSAGSRPSSGTPTAARSCRSGCPPSKGSWIALERGAKVADIGCGHGHSTVLMAEAFPNSTLLRRRSARGLDRGCARQRRGGRCLGPRRFSVGTAVDYSERGFDLICFFDCLHDLGDPVGAARRARLALADGGTVMLVEPYAADRVEDNEGPISRLYYSASTSSAARTRSRRAVRTCSGPGRRGSARRCLRRGGLHPLAPRPADPVQSHPGSPGLRWPASPDLRGRTARSARRFCATQRLPQARRRSSRGGPWTALRNVSAVPGSPHPTRGTRRTDPARSVPPSAPSLQPARAHRRGMAVVRRGGGGRLSRERARAPAAGARRGRRDPPCSRPQARRVDRLLTRLTRATRSWG